MISGVPESQCDWTKVLRLQTDFAERLGLSRAEPVSPTPRLCFHWANEMIERVYDLDPIAAEATLDGLREIADICRTRIK